MASERAAFQARNLSSTIGQLLQDIHLEAAPAKPKPKPKPKNYARENFNRLKDIQVKCKQKEEEKLKLSQKKVGVNKYKNVRSKVFIPGKRNNASEFQNFNDERNPATRSKLSTCESSMSILPPLASGCDDENSNESPSPKPDLDEDELNKLKNNEDQTLINDDLNESISSHKEIGPTVTFNHEEIPKESGQGDICNNALISDQHLNAISHAKIENNDNVSVKSAISNDGSVKSNASDTKSTKCTKGKQVKVHQLGEIPKYLIQRQYEQREEKLKQKKEVDPSIPPGHVILSEEERLSTLEKFQKNKDELLCEFIHLPFCCDTLRARRRKEMLEKELAKMDEGIQIFSKHRVIIKIDE